MVLRSIWIVAISGSRPNSATTWSPAESRTCRERIRLALKDFSSSAEALGGRIELVSSVAAEADRIAIEIAESMGLSIHIILPLPILEFAKDFRDQPQLWDWVLAAIAKGGGLIGQDDTDIAALRDFGERKTPSPDWLTTPKPGWTFRIADGAQVRDACYYDSGTQMLDAADALLVVENKIKADILGGTHDLLNQAQARGIAIARINAFDPEPIPINWSSGRWAVDGAIQEVDSARKRSSLPINAGEPIEGMFAALDELANRTGGRLKNRVTTMIALQFSATILALVSSVLLLPKISSDNLGRSFKWDAVLIGYEVLSGCAFVCLVLALSMGLASRWTHLKSQWRQTRFGAEVLRSLIHTRGIVDPLFPIISRHNPAWHRFALSAGLAALHEKQVKKLDGETIKATYHHDRLEHQREAYYRKQLAAISQLSAVCGTIAIWAGALAPISLVLAMYLKFAHLGWTMTSAWSPLVIRLLPVLLSLLAGTATSVKVVTDTGRRAERYKIQVDRLQAISDWFPTLKTSSSIRRAVVLTEEVLLDELIEWHAASKK